MKRSGSRLRVLAIQPTKRGFGFVVMEGPCRLVDWGVKSGRSLTIRREQQLFFRVADLVRHYRPNVMIVPVPDARRSDRIRLFMGSAENLAIWEGIRLRKISVGQVKAVFAAFGARTKQEIACAVALQMQEFGLRPPRKRAPGAGEDYSTSIFAAAALSAAYFQQHRRITDSR